MYLGDAGIEEPMRVYLDFMRFYAAFSS